MRSRAGTWCSESSSARVARALTLVVWQREEQCECYECCGCSDVSRVLPELSANLFLLIDWFESSGYLWRTGTKTGTGAVNFQGEGTATQSAGAVAA